MKTKVRQHSKKLNPQRELFCNLFARDADFIGNATRSYIEAYGLSNDQYNSAVKCASRLLTNADIQKRVNELLDECLDDRIVDRELVKVILQNDDLGAKIAGIREYGRLRNRTAERLEGNFTFSWEA